MRQGDLSHTRCPRVTETLRQSAFRPPQQRKEGDCIVGAYNRSAIGTLVERTFRYTILLHLDGESRAGAVRAAHRDVQRATAGDAALADVGSGQ